MYFFNCCEFMNRHSNGGDGKNEKYHLAVFKLKIEQVGSFLMVDMQKCCKKVLKFFQSLFPWWADFLFEKVGIC